jgi:hypothetical protein
MQEIAGIANHDEEGLLRIIAEHEAASEALLLQIVEIQSDPSRLNEEGAEEIHRLWEQCKPHDETREAAWTRLGELNQQTLYALESTKRRVGLLRSALFNW